MVGKLKVGGVVLAVVMAAGGGHVRAAEQKVVSDQAKAAIASDAARQKLQELEAEAKRRFPHLSEAEGMAIVARESAERELAQTSGLQRDVTAASAFMGMYVKHTESFVAECRAVGVDVSGFAAGFSKRFVGEHAAALKILHRAGANDSILRQLWENMRPSLAGATQRELTQVGQGDFRVGCERVRDNAAVAVDSIRLTESVRGILTGP